MVQEMKVSQKEAAILAYQSQLAQQVRLQL